MERTQVPSTAPSSALARHSIRDDSAYILSLPLDILRLIFASLPFRPILTVASLVCKKFRLAALLLVTSVTLHADVSASDVNKLVQQLPHLTRISLRNFQPNCAISFPPSLRTLAFHPEGKSVPSAQQVQCLSSLQSYIKMIELFATSDSVAAATFILASSCSLTSLSLSLRSVPPHHLLCQQLNTKFYAPSLQHLSLAGASLLLLRPDVVTAHASHLTSLTVGGMGGSRFQIPWIAQSNFPLLQQLTIGTDDVSVADLLTLASRCPPTLRLAIQLSPYLLKRSPQSSLEQLADRLSEATLTGDAIPIANSFGTLQLFTRLSTLHLGVPVTSLWWQELVTSPLASLVCNVHIESHSESLLPFLPTLSSITHLRICGLTSSFPLTLRATTLLHLEVETRAPSSLLALSALHTTLPRLSSLRIDAIPSDYEAFALTFVPLAASLQHLKQILVSPGMYYSRAMQQYLRNQPWTNIFTTKSII